MSWLSTQIAATNSTTQLTTWQGASWVDYLAWRDRETDERLRLFFDEGWLWIDMGAEGINHASICDLFTMLFFIWAGLHPDQLFTSLGRCILEKAPIKVGAPDLVLYVGEPYPRWRAGEPRRIDLHQWPLPKLVGEISDTTLTADLDQKKKIYADLGIPEYWVINVQGQRVFAFKLLETGRYEDCSESMVLQGLPIAVLNEALERLEREPNTRVAAWLSEEILQWIK